MTRYVLDACALLALLQNETGNEKVISVFNEAADEGTATITMNTINLLEVYYKVYKARGKEQAERMITELKKLPVTINQEISDELFAQAGRFKVMYTVSLADSIALAQASLLNAQLLTADHHEFDAVEKSESVRFLWIR